MKTHSLILRAAFWLLALALQLMAFAGCASIRARVRPPSATISTPSGATVTQTGDAQVPASTHVATQTQSVPIPAGSVVEFSEKLGVFTYRLSKDSLLTTVTHAEQATAPQAFTPPAPPSPKDEADGKAQWIYRIALVVGIALAIFGLVRAWDFVMWGGVAVAGAALVGLFVASHPLLTVLIGTGAGVAVAGVLVWHIHLKDVPAKLEALARDSLLPTNGARTTL